MKWYHIGVADQEGEKNERNIIIGILVYLFQGYLVFKDDFTNGVLFLSIACSNGTGISIKNIDRILWRWEMRRS